MTLQPDIFCAVHKGIRHALFSTCTALGRAEHTVPPELRAQLRSVLHFVQHHGENEDLLLLPLLATAAPDVHDRMRAAHTEIDAAVVALVARLEDAPPDVVFHATCDFTARYLAHMRDEELAWEPTIRAAVPAEALAAFPRGSVARTAPDDAKLMLGWMLAALPPSQADAMRAGLPEPLRRALGRSPG